MLVPSLDPFKGVSATRREAPGQLPMGDARWLGPGNTGIGAVHKTPKWQVWVEKQFRGVLGRLEPSSLLTLSILYLVQEGKVLKISVQRSLKSSFSSYQMIILCDKEVVSNLIGSVFFFFLLLVSTITVHLKFSEAWQLPGLELGWGRGIKDGREGQGRLPGGGGR